MTWAIYLILIFLLLHAAHAGSRMDAQKKRFDLEHEMLVLLAEEVAVLKARLHVYEGSKTVQVVDTEWKVVTPTVSDNLNIHIVKDRGEHG